MRHIRLYLPQDWPEAGKCLSLPEDARHYVVTVLRARDGFSLTLFNGQGLTAQATLVLERKSASVRLESITHDTASESPLQLTLAQGISRGERMDISLQKATELGVSAIQPLFTEFCEVKLDSEDKLAKRMTHWQQVIVSACEQSRRTRVPQLHPPITLTDWLANTPCGLVLHPGSTQRLRSLPAELMRHPLSLLVGPEGGLSDHEVVQALAAGLTGVDLGPRILRTETAGPAAIAALQSLFGDA